MLLGANALAFHYGASAVRRAQPRTYGRSTRGHRCVALLPVRSRTRESALHRKDNTTDPTRALMAQAMSPAPPP